MAVKLTLVALIVATLIWAATAQGACLTEREARERFPGTHLWWYGEHCWSNRRGGPPEGKGRETAPVEVRDSGGVPKPAGEPAKPAEKPSSLERAGPGGATAQIYYPGLVKGDALEAYPALTWHQPWLSPDSIVFWPLLIDVDRTPFVTWNRRIGQ